MFSGDIELALRVFAEERGIAVGFFDAHSFKEQLLQMGFTEELLTEALAGHLEPEWPLRPAVTSFLERKPRYYLVYFGVHVFPVYVTDLVHIFVDFTRRQQIQERKFKSQQFCQCSPLLLYMYKQYLLAGFANASGVEAQTVENNLFLAYRAARTAGLINSGDLSFKMLLAINENLTLGNCSANYMNRVGTQLCAEGSFRQRVIHRVDDDALLEQFDRTFSMRSGPENEEEFKERRSGYVKTLTHACTRLQKVFGFGQWWQSSHEHESEEERNESRRRSMEFDEETGLFAIDIETCVDNSLYSSQFNMVPYILTGYGRLLKLIKSTATTAGGKTKSILTKQLVKDISVQFVGLDQESCISQFVQWLLQNAYVLIDVLPIGENGLWEMVDGAAVPKGFTNAIFAHNGFNFDYRFLYKELHKLMNEFHMVGDIQQTKFICGNGLEFYDFCLIYRDTLKHLAETFFPEEDSKHKAACEGVVGLTIETVREWLHLANADGVLPLQLRNLVEYCQQDSRVLYMLVDTFFRRMYTHKYGHCFMRKKFYHSLSALSWDMLVTCFLRQPLFTYRITREIERSMKIGGWTCAYLQRTGFGIFIDANSLYPYVMTFAMPWFYEKYEYQCIETLEQPWLLQRGGGAIREQHQSRYKVLSLEEAAIRATDMYEVKYRFPVEENLPTICAKTGDTLVMVSESEHYDDNDASDRQWLYGNSLILAVQFCRAEVKIFRRIRFMAAPLFKDYIMYHYEQRLQCKKKHDDVGSNFHKGCMNSSFGKMGQKDYPEVVFGSAQYVRDYANQLRALGDCIRQVEIVPVPADDIELWQLRYKVRGSEFNHKGALLRFSNYIMEMGRIRLMQASHLIQEVFGCNNKRIIAYSDTDSIGVNLAAIDPTTDAVIQDIRVQWEKSTRGSEEEKALLIQMQQKMEESWAYKKLMELRLPPVDCLTASEDRWEPMIDNDRLGAFKIEKKFVEGFFYGAKQYGVRHIVDNGRAMEDLVKWKGICRNKRTWRGLIEGVGVFRNDANPFIMIKQERLQRMGAGVISSTITKILGDTLFKRAHNYEENYSEPFQTVSAYRTTKETRQQEMREAKRLFREQRMQRQSEEIKEEAVDVEGMMVTVAADNGNEVLRQAVRRKNAHQTQVRKMLIDEEGANDNSDPLRVVSQDLLNETRKRFLVHLPKWRFEMMQDYIALQLQKDEIFQEKFTQIVPHLQRMVDEELIRTGLFLMDEAHYSGQGLPVRSCTEVVAFCLYLHYYVKEYGMTSTLAIHKEATEFLFICDKFYQMMAIGENTVISEEDRASFEHAVTKGFYFLAAPISETLLDGGGDGERERTIGNISQGVPLECNECYTSLWRLMHNLLCIEAPLVSLTTLALSDVPLREEQAAAVSFNADLWQEKREIAETTRGKGQLTKMKILFLAKYVPRIREFYEERIYNSEQLVGFLFDECLHDNTREQLQRILAEEKNLWKLFATGKQQSKAQRVLGTRKFVLDLLVIFQFFWVGGLAALETTRNLFELWGRINVQHRKSEMKKFIYAMRVLFSNQQMLFALEHVPDFKQPGKKIEEVLLKFIDWCTGDMFTRFLALRVKVVNNDNSETVIDDRRANEVIQATLSSFVNGNKNDVLYQLFALAIATPEVLQSAVTLTEIVLKWHYPDQKRLDLLRAIILLAQDTPANAETERDNASTTMERQNQINGQLLDEFFQVSSEVINQNQPRIISPVGNDNASEDNSYAEDDYLKLRQFQLQVLQEDEREETKKESSSGLRQLFTIEEEEEGDDDQWRIKIAEQDKHLKLLSGNPFLDVEAEEGEGSDDDVFSVSDFLLH